MKGMQTTALKINGIPKLWWVIIAVISIDQQCGYVKFPVYRENGAKTPDTGLDVYVFNPLKKVFIFFTQLYLNKMHHLSLKGFYPNCSGFKPYF